mmetsp:Transcript_30742/g.77749  ORF Transcript_30742/g.77749 Transcript_30742/m.77749 type:complete len:265 (-) Transcript_30742:44-838(-)
MATHDLDFWKLGAPALAKDNLAPLGIGIGQLAVVLELRVLRHRGGDIPRREGCVVHAAATHRDEARVLRRPERGHRQGAQQVRAEHEVGGKGGLQAFARQGLGVQQGPGVANQGVQSGRLCRELLPATSDFGLDAHIRLQDLHLLILRGILDLLTGSLGALPVPADHVDGGALLRQERRDLLADARVRARDYVDPVRQVRQCLQQVGRLVALSVLLVAGLCEVLPAVQVELACGCELSEHRDFGALQAQDRTTKSERRGKAHTH